MTNSRSTKSALLTSVVAILLCCTMLLGTTFAWFTDTATSANNVIKAGNLDVDLLVYTDTDPSENGVKMEYVSIEDESMKDTPIFNYALWEPGTEISAECCSGWFCKNS